MSLAYNTRNLKFGREHIIPKPMDLRLIEMVSIAIAKAAINSGVARRSISNWDAYREELKQRLGLDDALLRVLTNKARSEPKRVVFAEADNYKIIKQHGSFGRKEDRR